MASISAVIPTYARPALLRRAVASARAAGPDEVVVVADPAVDPELGDLEAAGVRVVREPNRGVAGARNAGVRAAQGTWVAFLDDDDVWRPEHIARMRSAIDATDGAATLYFADAALPGGATRWGQAGLDAPATAQQLERRTATWAMLPCQPMMTPASVVSRAAYLECGGHDEALPCREDTHLFFALALAGPLCAVPGVGADVTADAQGERLTATLPSDGTRYWEATVRMYADLLARSKGVWGAEHRAELRRRLAVAHWRIGRLAWRERRPAHGAGAVLRSLRTEPRVVAERLARRPA